MARRRIGILTSGGDCAGLNAAIRAVVCRADLLGFDVYGIEDGTLGLLADPPRYRVLKPVDVDVDVMRKGGTFLGTTNKDNPTKYVMPDGSIKDRTDEIVAAVRKLGLDAVIGIGGDGSFDILRRLASKGGINLVGIPKTIDNDVGKTETAIGFDTAVAVATQALDYLQPTAASHDRIMILEVMGRDAGHIALNAGIAGAADVILIPEIPYTLEAVAQKIRAVRASGRHFALVIVSEAAKTPENEKATIAHTHGQVRYGGIGQYLSEKLGEMTGFETRHQVLGHMQRGAPPNWNDRLLASAFGVAAVDLVAAGKFDRMVAWSNRGVIDVPLADAIAGYAAVDVSGGLVNTARSLGISFGES